MKVVVRKASVQSDRQSNAGDLTSDCKYAETRLSWYRKDGNHDSWHVGMVQYVRRLGSE